MTKTRTVDSHGATVSPGHAAQFLTRADLRALGSRHGAIRLHAALYAPGAIPALGLLGPLLEAIGRAFPGWGAFQVLTITKEANT